MNSDVSRILARIEAGDSVAAGQLLPMVYGELRRLAAAKIAQEKPGQTLQATALVHEAYLKLVGANHQKSFANRKHFFSAAAEAMRQILVDQARRKLAVRHGGGRRRVEQSPEMADAESTPEQTILIHDLLERLTAIQPRSAQVAKMRLFLQMNFVETAEVLGLSADTVETDWAYARAWLRRAWQPE